MADRAELPTYTQPEAKAALLKAGACGTIYSLVMPESEQALAFVVDGWLLVASVLLDASDSMRGQAVAGRCSRIVCHAAMIARTRSDRIRSPVVGRHGDRFPATAVPSAPSGFSRTGGRG